MSFGNEPDRNRPLKKRLSRRRLVLSAILFTVIPLGLLSRTPGIGVPEFVSSNAGDTLWTVAAYLSLGLLFPKWRPIRLGVVSLAISFAVEASQLIDVGWLNAIRKTTPFNLLLGSTFVGSDLTRYTVGAVAATVADWLSQSHSRNRAEPADSSTGWSN